MKAHATQEELVQFARSILETSRIIPVQKEALDLLRQAVKFHENNELVSKTTASYKWFRQAKEVIDNSGKNTT